MIEFDELIEEVENMPLENQEIFLDIMIKRYNERKRQIFINEVRESKAEYQAGKYFEGNSDNLFDALKI